MLIYSSRVITAFDLSFHLDIANVVSSVGDKMFEISVTISRKAVDTRKR